MSNIVSAAVPIKASNKPNTKLYGINRSGAEFASAVLPGTPGVDFEYPTDKAKFEAFASRGLTLMRVPILWERVQPSAKANLDPSALLSLAYLLDTANAAGIQVILDLHNYGRYHGRSLEVSDADTLAHFWITLVTALGSRPALYGIELMNEPHDLPGESKAWTEIVQHTVTAIRQYNNQVYILAPGYSWQSARFWQDNNQNFIIQDPANKLLYSAHQYFDHDYTGTYKEPTVGNPNYGTEVITPFIDWLKQHNLRGIITEYGAPSNDQVANNMMRDMLSTVDTTEALLGAIYWASGPRWGNYELSVEPNDAGIFPNQIYVLQDFPTRTHPVSIPKGLKKGDFIKFTKDPNTYYVGTAGLHILANHQIYLNAKAKNKLTRLFVRADSAKKYTVRFTPLTSVN